MRSISKLKKSTIKQFSSIIKVPKNSHLLHAKFIQGGDLPRALDLCFRAGNEMALDPAKKAQSAALFEMVNTIAADLGILYSHLPPILKH